MELRKKPSRRVLVTGSAGLIGIPLCAALRGSGMIVTGLDRRKNADIVCTLAPDDDLTELAASFDGIVHLAGMTRVKWGEENPSLCQTENAALTERLTAACAISPTSPWLIYASSREVYGEPITLPVIDDAPLAPINVYGRSKVAAEEAVAAAGREGLRTAILRFSTVYGGVGDHVDRLFPALMQRALTGTALMLNGSDTILDPTWIDDAVEAILAVAVRLADGAVPDGAILLSSGAGASLADIAQQILRATSSRSAIVEQAPRDYDTHRFVGNPARARAWLGWHASTQLDEGVRRYAARLIQ
jgi:UDP-glucose 4-epimerase